MILKILFGDIMSKALVKKVIICLTFSGVGFLVVFEVQRLGLNVVSLGGAIFAAGLPLAWDWFNRYNSKVNSLRDSASTKVEELDEKVESRLDEIHNRISTLATKQELDSVRAETYGARAEAQQALNIVSMALEQSQVNQTRINDLLSEGVLFKLTEMATKLDLRQNILEKRRDSEDR